jgi:hypothetical protein
MMQTEGKTDRKNKLGDVQKDILPTSKHSSQNQRAIVRRYTYHVQINNKVRRNAKLNFLDEESSDGTSSQDTYQAEAQ